MKLSKRLQCVAEQVPPKSNLIDIGTDHGLLPGWLLSKNHIRTALAIDIRPNPLKQAIALRTSLGLSSSVFSTLLADGLQEVSIQKPSVVSIAGMGARTIIRILNAISDQQYQFITNLILQPNQEVHLVRKWCWDNQWALCNEEMVKENGKFYVILNLHPTQGYRSGDQMDAILGPFFIQERPQIWLQWVTARLDFLQHLEKRLGDQFPSKFQRELAWMESHSKV